MYRMRTAPQFDIPVSTVLLFSQQIVAFIAFKAYQIGMRRSISTVFRDVSQLAHIPHAQLPQSPVQFMGRPQSSMPSEHVHSGNLLTSA